MTAPTLPPAAGAVAAATLTTWPSRGRSWALTGDTVTIGRAATTDVHLDDDPLVSRLHARLERVAGTWTVVDDGLSRNGTFVNGRRIDGRCALRDGDQLRVGQTLLVLSDPLDDEPRTLASDPVLTPARLTPAQKAVLSALCRPYARGGAVASPATNAEIAAELFLSVETVKTHLRSVCLRLGIEHLPAQRKRLKLVELALSHGLVSLHDLRRTGG